MKTKIPKEVLQFFLENGTVVDIVEGQKKYTFLPYWFDVIDAEKGIVIFHSLENVPDELKEAITEKREVVKPIEINKEDVDLWFEEQFYDGRSEECLHNYIAVLRYAQRQYQMGEESFSGLTLLNDSFNNNVISYKMLMTLIPLVALPDLEYTIVHKKDGK